MKMTLRQMLQYCKDTEVDMDLLEPYLDRTISLKTDGEDNVIYVTIED